MDEKKLSKIAIDIFAAVVMPVIAGALFIVWVIHFLKNPVLSFPLAALLILPLYYVSGHVYSGIMLAFAVVAGFFGMLISDDMLHVYSLIAECIWLVFFYFIIDTYRESYLSVKNSLHEEYETLDREIALKNSEINENRKRTSAILQQLQGFQQMGSMIQTFEVSLDDKSVTEKTNELAAQFIGAGEWKLKKNVHGDVFAKYIKDTGLPLIITDISTDRRFTMTQNRYLSVIAVPVDVNGGFWGVLRGTSEKANAFDEADLRLLSILSGIISTVLSNAHLYREIQNLAVTDGLTGLYTQSYFKERLREEMNRAKMNKVALSLAILDVDFFKTINDTYGHQSGDIILRQIAVLLRGRFRETDLLCRYGGEEFGVIMLHTNIEEAGKILEEMRKSIEKERFFLPAESSSSVRAKVTVSIGYAELGKSAPFAEDELIKMADKALYDAKNTGRNKISEFKND